MNRALQREWMVLTGLLAGGFWMSRRKGCPALLGLGALGLV